MQRATCTSCSRRSAQADRQRLDEHLTSVRDLERAIASLPPDYGKNVKEPEDITDLKDWPRIAKLQRDLLVHALASGQTRVASYMLTKCQSLTRFPWLGLLGQPAPRLHAHQRRHRRQQQRIMRDICRWHVEEFAYLLAKLKSIPEGDGNLLDNTCVRVRARARRGQSAQEQRPGDDPRGPRRRHEDRHALEDAQHHRRRLPDDRRRSLQAAAREGLPDRGDEGGGNRVSGK